MSLQATALRYAIGRKPVLKGVDFLARPGEVSAIVGPNGSGKTTLLRALTGEVAAEGRISLNGRDIQLAKPYDLAAQRGVLPQASALAFPFTVIEVVRMGVQAGLHATHPRLAETALETVGLAGYGNRFVQELSGGEQQRAQLARVLAQVWDPVVDATPRWLFLDEPVSSLDIGQQLGVMQLVRSYADRGGGVVAVMHDLNLTAMFADRVTLMQAGQARAAGTVEEVLTDDILSAAYGCRVRVNAAPPLGGTFLLPHAASRG